MEIAITAERADETGWIAFAPEVRATAQGATEEEAKENLRALLKRYPDLLEEPRQASDRRVERNPDLTKRRGCRIAGGRAFHFQPRGVPLLSPEDSECSEHPGR